MGHKVEIALNVAVIVLWLALVALSVYAVIEADDPSLDFTPEGVEFSL